ncbi:hypothetical protein BDW22DRAFT_1221381 [Trametopsis cervina]|nr:hypothetical protein BDW22DRAFT_1221381 [Trametopsis cervina]
MTRGGKNVNGHHLLNEQEKTIADLQVQLDAQASRSSHFQCRVLSVLDNMDHLQAQHHKDLSSAEMTRQSLQTRLNDLMEYTAKVEEERDELKSCVQAVLEKIQANDDFSTWPHARISRLEPLEPVRMPEELASTSSGEASEYTTIIALLRAELEREPCAQGSRT